MESIDGSPEGNISDEELAAANAGALILRPSVREGGLDGLLSTITGERVVVVRTDPPQSIDTKTPEVPKE